MATANNGKIMQEVYNHFSNNQFDTVLTHAAEDVEIFFAPTGQRFQGHEGFKQFMMSFKSAFPNIKLNVMSQIVSDDAVVTEFKAVGTHTGSLMTPKGEIPATGRTAEWSVCEVNRFRDGQLVSLHNYQDLGSMLQQLGLM
jgi:steroid delta-isomerase-like uncharacterized protein